MAVSRSSCPASAASPGKTSYVKPRLIFPPDWPCPFFTALQPDPAAKLVSENGRGDVRIDECVGRRSTASGGKKGLQPRPLDSVIKGALGALVPFSVFSL